MKKTRLMSAVLAGIIILSGCQQQQPLAKAERIVQESEYDIDLRGINANIIYATIFNMVQQPSTYLNMSVSMYGNYKETVNQDTNSTYHFCVVPDALKCCSQGIEFKYDGENYPDEGQEIEITGIFSSYEEGGQEFYYIDASYCGLVE